VRKKYIIIRAGITDQSYCNSAEISISVVSITLNHLHLQRYSPKGNKLYNSMETN